MKNSLLYRCSLPTALVVLLFLLLGCKKEDQAAPDPNAIREGNIRITATINAPGTEPADVYRVVGNFWRPNYYNIAGTFVMKKQPDGTYRLDFSKQELVDDFETLWFTISRNGTFGEADAFCLPHKGHSIPFNSNVGKEIKINVVAFRGTGSCPPK